LSTRCRLRMAYLFFWGECFRSFLIRSLRYLNGRTLSPFPTEAGQKGSMAGPTLELRSSFRRGIVLEIALFQECFFVKTWWKRLKMAGTALFSPPILGGVQPSFDLNCVGMQIESLTFGIRFQVLLHFVTPALTICRAQVMTRERSHEKPGSAQASALPSSRQNRIHFRMNSTG